MGELQMKTAILINVKDRPSELALLLQSLRTQSYQGFDIFILDDCSGTPLTNYHFFNCVINRLKSENHKVFIKRTDFSEGVSKARHKIVQWANEFDYEFYARVDDDVVLEPDYIERLFKVIEAGYDLASGVTVPMASPSIKRDPKFLNGIVNRIILDDKGDYIMCGDDCGMEYTESLILPAHHFRSCALYKSSIHKKVNYCPTKLSWHGFREEQIFSYKLILEGYKIGVDTGAINYHQMTPSGGERSTQTNENTMFNQKQLEVFTKENEKELSKFFPNDPMPTKLELSKATNLLMK
jgi:glycosyltransferase involved in cell wall biosynthesis